MRWVRFASQVESETPGTIASTWCTPLDPPDQSAGTWSAASCRAADTGEPATTAWRNDDLYHIPHITKKVRGTPKLSPHPHNLLKLNTLFLRPDQP